MSQQTKALFAVLLWCLLTAMLLWEHSGSTTHRDGIYVCQHANDREVSRAYVAPSAACWFNRVLTDEEIASIDAVMHPMEAKLTKERE
jgi:hypothetical protein